MSWWPSFESVLLFFLIYKALDWLVRRIKVGRLSERYILVTGCDTGFGNMIVKRLDALGCHVFAGCLTETGATDLKNSCSSGKLLTVSMDVTNSDSIKAAYEIVKSKIPAGKGLWAVLNNAGILGPIGPLEWLRPADLKVASKVNLDGLIEVSMTFLPLVKAAQGRIINVSSAAGRFSVPELIGYCVSKYGAEAFTDGLRRAMYPWGVKAILIEPGWHMTPITSRENVVPLVTRTWNQASPQTQAEYGEEYFEFCKTGYFDNLDKTGSHRVTDVVDAYAQALFSVFPRARYVVGADAKYIFGVLQVLPEWLSDWLLFVSNPKAPLPAALKNASNHNKNTSDNNNKCKGN